MPPPTTAAVKNDDAKRRRPTPEEEEQTSEGWGWVSHSTCGAGAGGKRIVHLFQHCSGCRLSRTFSNNFQFTFSPTKPAPNQRPLCNFLSRNVNKHFAHTFGRKFNQNLPNILNYRKQLTFHLHRVWREQDRRAVMRRLFLCSRRRTTVKNDAAKVRGTATRGSSVIRDL